MTETKNAKISTFFEQAGNLQKPTAERISKLEQIAQVIYTIYKQNKTANINFICTENSRRSQLAQIWAFFAVEYFQLKNIYTFSGGTKITSLHRNVVKTLKKIGFEFNVIDFSHQNPKYLITFKESKKSILGFSKHYENENIRKPYVGITTCHKANETCNLMCEEITAFHLPFTDPKGSDNTNIQEEVYLETSQQIAGELYILFKKIKEKHQTSILVS